MKYVNIARCYTSGLEVLTISSEMEVLSEEAFPGLELGDTITCIYNPISAKELGIPYPEVMKGLTIMRPMKNKDYLRAVEESTPEQQRFTALQHLAIDRYVATYGEEPSNMRAFIKSWQQHGLRKAVMVKH